MESVATEDLLLATLLTDDGASGGTALSTVLERTSGSGQRPSRQVEAAVAVERLDTQGFVRRESDGSDERLRLTEEGRSRAEEVVDRLPDVPVEVVEDGERRESTLERAAERFGRSPASIAADCSEAGVYHDRERTVDREFVDREDERAREYLEESLGIHREIGDPDGEAHDLNYLGHLARRRGSVDRAREYHEQALDLARERDLARREPMGLSGRCALARREGDYDRASEYFERALRLSEDANKQSDVVRVRLEGARLALARGDPETARERAEAVRDTAESLGRRLSTGRSRRVLGDIASTEGDATTAREHWEAAVETFEAIGAVPDALETLETLVEDCRARGDDERAREYSRRARAVLDDAPAPAAEAHGEWVETQERATEEA